MNELEQIVERLEVLLADERAAIRRVDADACAEFAEEKLRLFHELMACAPGAAMRGSIGPRVAALVDGVKRNGILLAHARDTLRDALAAARGGSLMVRSRGPARELVPAPRALVSVRG